MVDRSFSSGAFSVGLTMFSSVLFLVAAGVAGAWAGDAVSGLPYSPAYALASRSQQAQRPNMRETYRPVEFMVPMRDGTKLYTIVWIPKDKPGKHPILMERTCYGAGSPGVSPRRGYKQLIDAGYILAFQDVRGKGKSEGDFVNVRPQLKRGQKGIDESTDTYDTVDYLIKNVETNNGNAGLWGISYPGFYAGVGAINNHPALKAVSPQAPVSDWFIGDDVHHNGAFFVQENFDFSIGFDVPRGGERPVIDREGLSAYDFFLKAGGLANYEPKFLKGKLPYWNELMAHGTYDEYWKDRSLPRAFKNVNCAVLVVGGFFDKEDMWGALNLFKMGVKQNPKAPIYLAMGPWSHGQWASGQAGSLGEVAYGELTGKRFQEEIEFPFFEQYLNGHAPAKPLSKATIFETGVNKWHTYNEWPPRGLSGVSLYLGAGNSLSVSKPAVAGEESYVYDPSKPTPNLADYANAKRAPGDWLIYDQKAFSSRSDVVSYMSPVLDGDQQTLGPVEADIWLKTTGTDADVVVKVIDVYPDDSTDKKPDGSSMAGFQMMVRSDIFRAKFRKSFEKPIAIVPGQPTEVKFTMNDTMHTFRKGHRIMVQIQSSWFPIADRNPNVFMDIYSAKDSDFKPATISILHGPKYPSRVVLHHL